MSGGGGPLLRRQSQEQLCVVSENASAVYGDEMNRQMAKPTFDANENNVLV